MQEGLDKLLAQNAVWRCGRPGASAGRPTVSTGYPSLDAVLPNGGWPRQALLEVLTGSAGIGELRLLMPALSTLLAERDGYLVWVGSPYQPYAPALLQWQIEAERVLVVSAGTPGDVLWACGEALSSGSAVAVLGWVDTLDITMSRRLSLAAEQGRSLAVLFRPLSARRQASAASVRLALAAGSHGTSVDLFKVSGARPCRVAAYEHETAFWPVLQDTSDTPVTLPG